MANSYNPNVVTQQQSKVITQKPISLNQAKKYDNRTIKKYNRQANKDARRTRKQSRHLGRQYRKNLKAAASENFKEKQLMHGTIRQGLAEGATMISQVLAPRTAGGIMSAVNQNTSGGVKSSSKDESGNDKSTQTNLPKGPVNAIKYSESERDED